ncbi:MerR family transcriptional regulator [Herbaspirillum sp. AP02]|uniref:MerR family transcriptional regulator n=1 Tax=unclassified Herbaspirillum TaxID=2624150 RepID=UPI0015D96BDB|nr:MULTISPECIES: MerR family transcriptional regulator [unclassified Herbaspirillum]MBG7620250.1 MerR family transcriptional regulator [Herbaspirillum sp. AP02]NZD67714.1 MerR family transcriptional regulator [Herbaspirillum sp. AP21]
MSTDQPQQSAPPADQPATESLRRTGAVARMLRMPVATLRVWERRYALTQGKLSPSGQRLYSEADVRRLALIRQLTELGHAIGSLAGLDMEQLQQVAATHAELHAVRPTPPQTVQGQWRVAVIGATLAQRLDKPGLLQRLGRPLQLLGPFESVQQAALSLKREEVDALLLHEPQLHAGWLGALESSAPALSGLPMAVLYGFASEAVCETLAAVGISLLRAPQPDVVILQWLRALMALTVPARSEPAWSQQAPVARRWSDNELIAFANRSTTVACECPRHVAELLMQLSQFERYSAQCANRNEADAQLHQYLQQLTTESRQRFEMALSRIAMHEGLVPEQS